MTKTAVLLLICFCIGDVIAFPNLGLLSGSQYQPLQPVDVSGAYAYQAPGDGDQRGPCPGLNALANHGYINRNGISTAQQVFDACLLIGLASDIAAVLAALAVVASNNEVFSIGNGSSLTDPGLNTHGFLEGDTSYKSCDCNLCPTQTGCDNFDFNDPAWSTTYDAATLNNNLFGVPTFIIAAKQRYDECQTNNPQCNFGATQAVFHYLTPCLFAYIFPNGTDGEPTETIENTWIGIEKNANQERLGIPGGGRIPDNWYPRQTPYTLAEANQCFTQIYTANPVLIGANVNGIFIQDDLQIPSQPNTTDIACFIYKAIFRAAPTASSAAVAALLNPVFVIGSWSCIPFSINS